MSVIKKATLFQALVVAALLGIAAWAPAADRLTDPNESYLRAYVLYDDGMKAVEAGQRETAVVKLKSAQTLIQKIYQSQPKWQPALVAYKLKKIENILKELNSVNAQQPEIVSGTEPEVQSE